MKKEAIQRKLPNLTKKEISFLLTATDIIKDKYLENRMKVRILSRISALGLCGGWTKDRRISNS